MAYAAAGAVAAYVGFTAGTVAYTVATYALTAAFTLAASFAASALTATRGASFSSKDNQVTVRQPAVAWEYMYGRVKKGGSYAFIHSTDNYHFLHMVIIIADRKISSMDEIYFDDQLVALDVNGDATGTDPNGDNYKGFVKVVKRLGATDQTAFAELISAAPDKWTAAHRLRGKACIYVRLKFDAKRFAQGVPNITVVGDGHKIYDPRDPGQDIDNPATWEFDDNATNVIADYLRDDKIGFSATEAEIPLDEWIAAVNACDETVPIKSGGSEKRYTCNGIVDSSNSHKDIIEGLLTSMCGELVVTGAHFKIYPAVWRAPLKSLSESDLRGRVNTKTRVQRVDLLNGVRGLFTSPENNYQPADVPAVISITFVALDGEENFLDAPLPYTNSASMGQRIFKIKLLESRQEMSTIWPCKMTAWDVEAVDTVMLNKENLGWIGKYFKVMQAPTIIEEGALCIDLIMRETHPSIFDWATDEEITTDPAPNTDFPNTSYQAEPASILVESGSDLLDINGAGAVISQMGITIAPGPGAFAYQYQLEWRRSDAVNWNAVPIPAHSETASYYIVPGVVDGKIYEVRAKAVGRYAGESEYVDANPHLVIGKDAPPGDVDEFLIEVLPDGTRRFDAPHLNPDADVRVGGGYQIFYAGGSTIDLETATELTTGKITSWPYESNALAAGEYTFACVVLDSSGNRSANPLLITSTLENPPLRFSVAHWNEKTDGWLGEKTDCFVNHQNQLEATSAETIADLPATIAELGDSIAAMVVNNSPITYVTPVFEVGADVTVSPLVSIDLVGTATIKMRSALTAAGGDLSALPFVDTGQIQCGFIQFEIVVTGTTPIIKSLSVILDGETLIDDIADLDTSGPSSGGFEKIATGHFRIAVVQNISAITTASVAAVQSGTGEIIPVLISKSATVGGKPAAEFKLYSAPGVLADATIDITLKGPKA